MPQEGFKKHPHHNLEIVSYVISGTLKHVDSMGTEQLLEAGTAQVMSAGTGVEHSETNPSEDGKYVSADVVSSLSSRAEAILCLS